MRGAPCPSPTVWAEWLGQAGSVFESQERACLSYLPSLPLWKPCENHGLVETHSGSLSQWNMFRGVWGKERICLDQVLRRHKGKKVSVKGRQSCSEINKHQRARWEVLCLISLYRCNKTPKHRWFIDTGKMLSYTSKPETGASRIEIWWWNNLCIQDATWARCPPEGTPSPHVAGERQSGNCKLFYSCSGRDFLSSLSH